MKTSNYAKLNSECELEIYTDNGLFVNGNTHTCIGGRMYEISGEDLLKIYALLQDKRIVSLGNIHENNSIHTIYNYIIVGENAEKEELLKMYVELIDKINHINQTRHWWERKIKITL